ncbi:MAG TPA: DHHA1 domain-containing protein, partial [Bacteroidota bacterium]|nr:DHHA1 domain-containing protein [Bacteroidota bacterium]
ASDINISVEDTQKDGDIFGHIVEASPTELIGKKVHAAVDKERRLAIMRNHSATHLLHNALRKALGAHVHQAGSFVGPEYLRFDFAHYAKLSDKELQEIESLVNEKIQENIPRTPNLNNIPFEEAKKMGALMFFGEKYGDRVNVIQFGDFSTEFCGGTHVNSTGEIGYFKILREESIASGVRRIEAVTHTGALEALKSQDAALDEKIKQVKLIIEDTFSLCKELNSLNPQSTQHIENILKTMNKMLEGIKNIPPIPNSVSPELGKHFAHRNKLNADLTLLSNELIDIRKKLEKEISHNRVQSKSEIIDSLIANSRAMNGYRVVASKVEATSLDELKSLGDLLRAKLQSGIGVLATVIDNKVQLVCVVTDDLIVQKKADAGKIVRDVAKLVNGGGGGKPHLATAGGKDIANIENALSEVAQIVEKLTNS